MSILRALVGIASELLTLKDPYETYVEPKILSIREEPNKRMDGTPVPGTRQVITVQANDYKEAGQFREGITIAGNVSKVATRVGRNRWELTVEVWDTNNGRGLTLQEYQDAEHPTLKRGSNE
jgi:hypothetical protein